MLILNIIKDQFDNTVKSREDIENYLDLMVLTSLPENKVLIKKTENKVLNKEIPENKVLIKKTENKVSNKKLKAKRPRKEKSIEKKKQYASKTEL